jgi:hypothetical protein
MPIHIKYEPNNPLLDFDVRKHSGNPKKRKKKNKNIDQKKVDSFFERELRFNIHKSKYLFKRSKAHKLHQKGIDTSREFLFSDF